MNQKPTRQAAYTLVEMVVVMILLSIIGLVSALVISACMKIYVRAAPALQADYQARLATERIKREVQDMKDTASVSVLASSALTFVNQSDDPVAFSLSGGNLLLNGDLLAQGLTDLQFTYWTAAGLPVTNPAELHLVEVDLSARFGDQSSSARVVAFPRCLEP